MATQTEIYQLYLAYFGRPPDFTGLNSFSNSTVAQVQAAFSASAESRALLASSDTATQVNNIYLNLFGRNAEPAGLAFWVGEIASGRVTLASAAFDILRGARNADSTTVANRIEVATAFVANYSASTAGILGYVGDAAAAQARTFLRTVTDTAASKTAALAGVAAAVTATSAAGAAAASTASGSTFTLTANLDSGPSFTGTSGNDTFNALNTTLTTGDNLVGGSGSDTLNITGTIGASATIAGFTLNSIESVNVSLADGDATAAHTLTLNMANAGASAVTLSGLAATTRADILAVTNLAAGSSLGLSGATNVDLNATFVAAATAGTADAVSVSLNNVASTAATDGILTVGGGFETMNISTSGAAASLDDVIFGGTRINVTGSQNLTVRQQLDSTLEVIDAAAFTGRLSIVTANDTTTPNALVAGVDVADISISGGTGNDTINLTANAADNELRVDAGAGDDTVIVGNVLENAATATAGDVLIGGAGNDTLQGDVDLFDVGTALISGTTSITGVTGFETLAINGFDAEANTVEVSNVSSDLRAVSIITATGGNTTINFGTAGAYTVNIGGAAAILDSDTLTVDAGGSGTTDTLTIANINAATGTAQIGANNANITVTDFETVTLNTGSYTTATAQLLNAVNVGTGALALTGSNGLTTTATTGIITAGSINASAMTGALVMGAAAASGVTTITGGSAADTLIGDDSSTISGGGGNDAITGGSGNDSLAGDAGNDTITAGAGSDRVDGGDGNDTFVFAGNLTSGDSVAGGAGTDTISLVNSSLTTLAGLSISEANTFNTNFTSVEVLQLTDALDRTTFDLGFMGTLTSVRLDAGITGPETLNGFDSGESLDLRAALGDTLTVGVNNAATGTADSFNVSLSVSGDTDYTDLAVANVETLTINNSEATASATVRANTIGLAITQATGGAAQSVVINGTEALTIDTAVAARTINASGLSVVQATDNGLTMGVAFTATTAITGQNITGSGRVDVLRGSTGNDSIAAGAGADAIHGNRGSDTIDGGDGTDTYHTTNLVGTNIEGAGTGESTGVVINLGSTALSNANVLGNSTQNLSAGLTSVAAGQVAYLFNTSSVTNSAVVKSLTSIENITLAANGINYVVGSDAANVVVGGTGTDYVDGGAGNDNITGDAGADTLLGGAGNDTITGGAGADNITAGEGTDTVTIGDGQDTVSLTETTAVADTLVWSTAFAAGNANAATVTGFAFGAGADLIDINFAVLNGTTTIAAGIGATNTLAGLTPAVVASNGTATANDVIFTFNGAGDLLAAGTTIANAVANAVVALTSGTDFSSANIATGDSLILQMNDGTNTFVFHYLADATAGTTAAADLALIGVFSGTTVQALLGDFI